MVASGSLQPECSLANASLIPDLFVFHMAAHKALVAATRSALKTRTLHAELVFNLSGSKHVSLCSHGLPYFRCAFCGVAARFAFLLAAAAAAKQQPRAPPAAAPPPAPQCVFVCECAVPRR
jgi:hypothetical protein